MIRQPKKPDKMYTVEVHRVTNTLRNGEALCEDPCVYAQSPQDAVVFALKKVGYNVSRKNVQACSTQGATVTLPVARVCLLGGTRESVTYYNVSI